LAEEEERLEEEHAALLKALDADNLLQEKERDVILNANDEEKLRQ